MKIALCSLSRTTSQRPCSIMQRSPERFLCTFFCRFKDQIGAVQQMNDNNNVQPAAAIQGRADAL